ncbi:uncharacterized protein A4U43_C04F15080 [Asparagus officinalis]|uniref:Uncharacterized protein n=1 Tax=Asparagus officinalis TaxID=4686 RepID=A0A5P1F1H7_ASPOF|nr:uncharacterized protein A4U43_C04F15080 [Asparagus officinalis]
MNRSLDHGRSGGKGGGVGKLGGIVIGGKSENGKGRDEGSKNGRSHGGRENGRDDGSGNGMELKGKGSGGKAKGRGGQRNQGSKNGGINGQKNKDESKLAVCGFLIAPQ